MKRRQRWARRSKEEPRPRLPLSTSRPFSSLTSTSYAAACQLTSLPCRYTTYFRHASFSVSTLPDSLLSYRAYLRRTSTLLPQVELHAALHGSQTKHKRRYDPMTAAVHDVSTHACVPMHDTSEMRSWRAATCTKKEWTTGKRKCHFNN